MVYYDFLLRVKIMVKHCQILYRFHTFTTDLRLPTVTLQPPGNTTPGGVQHLLCTA